MLYNAEVLSERLSQHSKDYKQGKTQDFEQILKDCEVAANMIKKLKTSKHTKKRESQRLRKRNRELTERIKQLEVINDFSYCVTVNKKAKEEIPVISRGQIEQFKKDLEKYSNNLC